MNPYNSKLGTCCLNHAFDFWTMERAEWHKFTWISLFCKVLLPLLSFHIFATIPLGFLLLSLLNSVVRLNVHKWTEKVVFLPFCFGNLLRAKTACTVEHLNFHRGALRIFACKCRSCHNGVQFFISNLRRWLRTRRFNEPIYFSTLRSHKTLENTVFRIFSTFFARLHLLSSDSFSSLIFFLLFSSLLWFSFFSSLLFSGFLSSLLCLFPPLLFQLSILSEVWLLIFFW